MPCSTNTVQSQLNGVVTVRLFSDKEVQTHAGGLSLCDCQQYVHQAAMDGGCTAAQVQALLNSLPACLPAGRATVAEGREVQANHHTGNLHLPHTYPCCVQCQLYLHAVLRHKVSLACHCCPKAARGKVLCHQRWRPQCTDWRIGAVPAQRKGL